MKKNQLGGKKFKLESSSFEKTYVKLIKDDDFDPYMSAYNSQSSEEY